MSQDWLWPRKIMEYFLQRSRRNWSYYKTPRYCRAGECIQILFQILYAYYFIPSNGFIKEFTQIQAWHFQQVICVISSQIVCYQILVTALILDNLHKILDKRYDLLKGIIREVYISTNRSNLHFNDQKLKRMHLLLNTTGKTVNEMFDKNILLIIIITFLFVLVSFQYMILDNSKKQFKEIENDIIFLVSVPFFYLLIIAVKFMTYDQCFFNTVYFNQQHIQNLLSILQENNKLLWKNRTIINECYFEVYKFFTEFWENVGIQIFFFSERELFNYY